MTIEYEWLFLLAPLTLILYLLLYRYKRKKLLLWSSTQQYGRDAFLFSVYAGLLTLSILFIVTALINPDMEKEQKSPGAPQEQTIDEIVIFQDVSASMNVADSKEGKTRLQRSQEIADSLVDASSGQTVSLYAFAGDVEKVAPATMDLLYIKLLIHSETAQSVSVAGSNFVSLFENVPREFQIQKKRHLIFFTDGEETFGIEDKAAYEMKLQQALEKLATFGDRITFVGVGDTAGGRVPDLKVSSKLDREALQKMAKFSKGSLYYDREMSLQEMTKAVLFSPLELSEKRGAPPVKQPFAIAIMAALFFTAIALFLPEAS